MPGLVRKRIGAVGTRECLILHLPKSWAQGNGITRGSEVSVLFANVLVVAPAGTENEARRVLTALSGGRLR